MNKKEMSDLFDVDFPDLGPITEETRRRAVETSQAGRYSHLPVRLATGRFDTDEEYKKYREEVLSMRIP